MKQLSIILFMSGIVLGGCSSTVDERDAAPSEMTGQQKHLAGIQTSELEYRLISTIVACTGEIEVPPGGMASVTAPLGGYIVETDIVPGTFVTRGSVLATLRNPEYVVLQQSYLETSGELKFAEQDFSRQKLLQEQNATAVKKLQQSESSFTVLKARLAGLKEQLQMIGIDFRDLEDGNIRSVVRLKAPLTGYITRVNHHPGQFVDPHKVIFEIVSMDELHLHLNAFEKDIARIHKGQSIRFRPAGGGDEMYSGKVSLVSPQRNGEVRTFDVHGHIDKEDQQLKPGMYVEAEIIISGDSAYALKENAVIRKGSESFVVVEDGGDYRVMAVDTGTKMDGWVEIRNHDALRNKKIVSVGASRLFAALERGD